MLGNAMSRRGRRQFLQGGLALTSLGLLSGCGLLPLPGQQTGRMHKIGFLVGGSLASDGPWVEAFLQGLRELGYAEGRDFAVEYRYGEGKTERFPELVAELVQLRVETIVTGGATATKAAKQGTSQIPLVMTNVTDPVAIGLVASLGHPGSNLTGLSNISPELAPKRLELLQQVAPQLKRVAILGDPSSPSHPPQWRQTSSAAQSIGVEVRSFEVREPNPDFTGAFAAISAFGADALITLTQPLIDVYRDQIVAFAASRRMPGMFHAGAYVESGGLMSYAPSIRELFRRAASFVDKILKGANPADLPVEQPATFEFVINLRTAQAFGLAIPDAVVQQATTVIR